MLVLEGNDCIPYSGKLCQLVENKIYVEKSYAACSLMLPKDASPSNLRGKLSQIATKPQNSRMLLPLKVSHYTLPSCITEREVTSLIIVNILFSCSNGHLEVVKMLVEDYHCGVNTTDDDGYTPLHEACR